MPVEGCLRADEPRLDSVHDPVHPREAGLAEESPRAARRVVLHSSVRLVRHRYRVRHQAPDGRLLRSAAGFGVLRPVPPSARHGAAGSAKRGGGWGSGREHVRQVRDGRGVPRVHVDPQEGGARGALGSCEGVCSPPMRRCKASSSVRLCGPAGGLGQGHAAPWEHCAHLLAPVGAAEDTVLHSPQRWQVCGRWEGGDQGPRRRSQRSSHR